MGQLIADITMSLDGFVTGPDPGPERPLGRGGERLHQWVRELASRRQAHGQEGGGTGPESDLMADAFERTGALVMGHRMYLCGEASWGASPPFHKPVFVLTRTPRAADVRQGGTTFHFVTDGLTGALEHALAAAGTKDIGLTGGADAIRQAIAARVLDRLDLHVVPVLIGAGTRLFDGVAAEHIEWRPTGIDCASGTVHLSLRPAAKRAARSRTEGA